MDFIKEEEKVKRVYCAINEGSHNDSLEPSEIGVSNEGSNYGEHTRYTNPSVYILSCCGGGFMELICEVHDEVTGQANECESLCHFNNCKTK